MTLLTEHPLPLGHKLRLASDQDKAICVKGIARDVDGASRTTDGFQPTKYGLQLYHNFSIEELEVLAGTNLGVAHVLINLRNVALFGGISGIRQQARNFVEFSASHPTLQLAA